MPPSPNLNLHVTMPCQPTHAQASALLLPMLDSGHHAKMCQQVVDKVSANPHRLQNCMLLAPHAHSAS